MEARPASPVSGWPLVAFFEALRLPKAAMGFNPVQKMCKDSVAWLAMALSPIYIFWFAKGFAFTLRVMTSDVCCFPSLTAKAGKPRTEKWILRKACFCKQTSRRSLSLSIFWSGLRLAK